MFASLFRGLLRRPRPRRAARPHARPRSRPWVEVLESRELLMGGTAQVDVLKFNDLNGNGTQDAGEPGLAGVTIQLLRGGDLVATAVTAAADDPASPDFDDTGGAWFPGLEPGEYTVRELVPAGFAPTTPTEVVVNAVADQAVLVVFGNRERRGQIDVLKFNDLNGNGRQDTGEPVLPGVTVQVLQGGVVLATAVTAAADDPATPFDETGGAWFPDLVPGVYTVRELVPAGFAPTTATEVQVTVVADQAVLVVFGNQRTGREGLTPGFWKNNAAHHGAVAWAPTGYAPGQTVGSVFAGATGALANRTLLQALNAGGGGVNALMRQAVAALLNAAHPDVHYPLTTAEVIQRVNDALQGRASVEAVKDLLEGFNELGAPLDQQGRRTEP